MIDSAQKASGFSFDVIGVGALNLDYIAGIPAQRVAPARSFTKRLSELLASRHGQDGASLEWGVEHHVDGHTIHAAIGVHPHA